MENNTTEVRVAYYFDDEDLYDVQRAAHKLMREIPKGEAVWFKVTIELVEGEMPNDPL